MALGAHRKPQLDKQKNRCNLCLISDDDGGDGEDDDGSNGNLPQSHRSQTLEGSIFRMKDVDDEDQNGSSRVVNEAVQSTAGGQQLLIQTTYPHKYRAISLFTVSL